MIMIMIIFKTIISLFFLNENGNENENENENENQNENKKYLIS